MRRSARAPAAALLALTAVASLRAPAEEGGTGHYMPGTTASFIDALPERPGLSVANSFRYYSASATFPLPIGGVTTATLDANLFADSIGALYRTSLEVLDANYSFGGVFPVLWMNVDGGVVTPGGMANASQSASGIGDVLLYPFMLGWITLDDDLKIELRVGVYAPTGKYEVGSIANVSKNYWTFEPTVGVTYLDSDLGIEASGWAGIDFNTKNTATDYLSGDQLHVDATLAKHLPLLGGTVGLGATGFYYQQITADSGSGARFGDFKGRTMGFGPIASFATKIGGGDWAFEAKWLPEFEVRNRLDGDSFWFKVRAAF